VLHEFSAQCSPTRRLVHIHRAKIHIRVDPTLILLSMLISVISSDIRACGVGLLRISLIFIGLGSFDGGGEGGGGLCAASRNCRWVCMVALISPKFSRISQRCFRALRT